MLTMDQIMKCIMNKTDHWQISRLNWISIGKPLRNTVDKEDFNGSVQTTKESHSSKLDSFKPTIKDRLLADMKAPRKQRHSDRRVYIRLCEKEGFDDRKSLNPWGQYDKKQGLHGGSMKECSLQITYPWRYGIVSARKTVRRDGRWWLFLRETLESEKFWLRTLGSNPLMIGAVMMRNVAGRQFGSQPCSGFICLWCTWVNHTYKTPYHGDRCSAKLIGDTGFLFYPILGK